MKSKNGDPHGRGNISGDAETLEGFTDMGMRDVALALAGEILKRPKPSPEEVSEALRAIGVHAYRMKAWNSRVVRMVDRLAKRTRYAVREDLLMFFAVNCDYERAASFIHAPKKFSTHARFLAVDTLISLRRFPEASDFAKKYLRDLSDEYCDAFESEAVAITLGTEGEHLSALLHRINAPIESAMEPTIIHGIIESTCALVIRHLASRIEKLRKLKKEGVSDPSQLTVPGINDALLAESEDLCNRIRDKLIRLIPKDRRFLYNMNPIDRKDDEDDEDISNHRFR